MLDLAEVTSLEPDPLADPPRGRLSSTASARNRRVLGEPSIKRLFDGAVKKSGDASFDRPRVY